MAKIAFFINSLHKAGAERVACNLMTYLQSRGHEILLVTQHQDEDEYALPAGIRRELSDLTERETGKSRLLNFWHRYRKLQRIWQQERPQVILSFIGKNNVMALLTACPCHIPVVAAVRGTPALEYEGRGLKKAAFLTFPRAAGVILQTEESRDFFPPKVQKKVTILPNPLHEDFLRPVYEGEREKTIVTVGRMDENKNQQMAIEAFAALAEEFPAYRLVLYGNGELKEKLYQEAQRLGVADKVSLPGSIRDVAGALKKASVFLLTSDTEGMPNTLLEAMALGTACISTDCPCGGPAMLIRDGENGFLVPVRDTKALTEKLRLLLQDQGLREQMGRKASKVQEVYAPENVLPQWEEYLLQFVTK